jgi:hypothetical protein
MYKLFLSFGLNRNPISDWERKCPRNSVSTIVDFVKKSKVIQKA